jgi:hypothetical protein
MQQATVDAFQTGRRQGDERDECPGSRCFLTGLPPLTASVVSCRATGPDPLCTPRAIRAAHPKLAVIFATRASGNTCPDSAGHDAMAEAIVAQQASTQLAVEIAN